MHAQDDLYTGNVAIGYLGTTRGENPTAQMGIGPLGRLVFLNIVPLALAAANIAALQGNSSGTGLTLTAGTGITTALAPDGSGRTVYVLDCERCISLTSTSDLSGVNYTASGFDKFGQFLTCTRAGPNNNTVTTLKGFASVLSVVPNATNGAQVSVGTADIFTLPFRLIDIGYIVSNKWAGVLAANAGTAVIGDTTSPATASTGDPRGTYAPSGAASNGTRRLVIAMHVDGTQAGWDATRASAIGVTPA